MKIGRNATMAFLLSISFFGKSYFVTDVLANSHEVSQSSTLGKCTITFKGKNEVDVAKVKKAFDDAVATKNNKPLSKDMHKKVKDACSKHSNKLTIIVVRDDRNVVVGKVPITKKNTPTGEVIIDISDLEKMKDHLEGTPDDITKVIDSYLIKTLAHEIDHNRDTSKEHHRDPCGKKAESSTGPAVDDENKVSEELGHGVQREQYGYKDTDGYFKVNYIIEKNRKVKLNFSFFKKALQSIKKEKKHAEHFIDIETIQNIPNRICEGDVGGQCYEPPSSDSNCPSLLVELASFITSAKKNGIYLNWETSAEIKNAGFRLWRATKNQYDGYVPTLLREFGHAEQVDPEPNENCSTKIQGQLKTDNSNQLPQLISAIGNSAESTCYSFIDTSNLSDGTYYYLLEDIDDSGDSTFHCDQIDAVTIGQGPAIDLESAINYCKEVTGNNN